MNVNDIFTGPNPFASGLPTVHTNPAKTEPATIFNQMEKINYEFQRKKDHGLNEISKEDLLHLDQEIFSAKLEQSRIDMLNQQGITEELLDGIGASLREMGGSAFNYLNQLDGFRSGLAAFDSSILSIQSKLDGATPMEEGEDADSLNGRLASLQSERQDYIAGHMGGLVSAAMDSESTIHQVMSGFQGDEDIWALLSSSNSKDVQKALDYLTQETLGMTMDPGQDLYTQMEASRKSTVQALRSVNDIAGLVNKYRKKLGLEPDNSIQFAATAQHQDLINQMYLKNSVWMRQEEQESDVLMESFHKCG